MNDDGYQQQLAQLKIEHRDLDDAIQALTAQTLVDQLQIARLKKKKLIVWLQKLLKIKILHMKF